MAKAKPQTSAGPVALSDEVGFVAHLEVHPDDATTHAAYADWLDEHGRPLEAAEQRDAAGISEFYYKLRRKSDGLFSEGRETKRGAPSGQAYKWSTKGKIWRKLAELRAHLASIRAGNSKYGGSSKLGTPWADLEVVAVEVRAVILASLPLSFRKAGQTRKIKAVTIEMSTSKSDPG